jgi:hypothetical protein
MNRIQTTLTTCAIATVLGSLSASAQTLSVQLKASNYNALSGVWTDSSGNGNSATFGGATTPTLVSSSTPNGSSAVDITTGGGSFALTTGIGFSSGYTVFAVIDPTTAAGRNALTGGSSPNALEYDLNGGNQDYLREYLQDVGHGNATISTSGYSLIDLAVNSSGASFDLNQASDGTVAGATFGSNLTRIGNNEGGGDGYLGDIAEIDIYSGVLSPSAISAEEAALTAEYITPVPEPSSWVMLAGGLGTLVAVRRFRRS